MTWPFDGLTPRKYGALLVDPPWHFKARTALQMSNPGSRRDVERHYPVMSLADIKALPVGELAAKNAHLFICVTGPMLKVAFEVMEEWGFRYSSDVFVWIKTKRTRDPNQFDAVRLAADDLHVGLGLTSRKNAEYVLLGRRGSPRRNAKDVRQVILAPRREHSRKPDEIFERIERYCDGPYCELFSRQTRPGWDTWGRDRGLFDAADSRQPTRSPAPARRRRKTGRTDTEEAMGV